MNTEKAAPTVSYLQGTAIGQKTLDEMARRQIVPQGERLLAIFGGLLYDPSGARVGGLAFSDYLIVTTGHVMTWARDQAKDYVDRFPLAATTLAGIGKKDAAHATARLTFASKTKSVSLTFDMLPVADMEQFAETIVGMSAAARDIEANHMPAAMQPRAIGLAFDQLIASRYPASPAPAAAHGSSLADKARQMAANLEQRQPRAATSRPSSLSRVDAESVANESGKRAYDPFADGSEYGAVTPLSRLDMLDGAQPYGDIRDIPAPAQPDAPSRLSRIESISYSSDAPADSSGLSFAADTSDALPLADGGNVELYPSSRKRGPAGRIMGNLQGAARELRVKTAEGGSASPPDLDPAPFMYMAGDETAADNDDDGEELPLLPHTAKPINPARVAWGRAMQNHLAPLAGIAEEQGDGLYTVSRFGRVALDAMERLRKDVQTKGIPGVPRDLSLHEVTEALVALNNLFDTLGNNPAARDLAMAFINKGAGALKPGGNNGRDAIDFDAPDEKVAPPAPERRKRISLKNAATPAHTHDDLPELELAADLPPFVEPQPRRSTADDHAWDEPDDTDDVQTAPIPVATIASAQGISIKKRRSIVVSAPADMGGSRDDELVPADDIRL